LSNNLRLTKTFQDDYTCRYPIINFLSSRKTHEKVTCKDQLDAQDFMHPVDLKLQTAELSRGPV
jgi:hypothetical protein